MVGRCLQREIKRYFQAKLLGARDQLLEVFYCAQFGVGGGVVLDGPRASHITGLSNDRVIFSLAVHLANGMNGWKIHRIEAHIGHAL